MEERRAKAFGGLPDRMRAVGVGSLLGVVLALGYALPAGAVLGGTQVQITDAPWQVEMVSFSSDGFPYCGGTIISDRLVLTAAHCVANALYTSVVAGVSEYNGEPAARQLDRVSGMRIDPRFTAPGGSEPSADDVAVVELETPLTFGAGAVEPIALAPVGTQLPAGTAVHLTGFGQHGAKAETPLNESLYALSSRLISSDQCGGEAGAFLCASTSTGSTCFGDSGSGLTLEGTPATLIGLVDRVEPTSGETCTAGAKDAFVNLTSAAIREFIGNVPTPQGAGESPSSGSQPQNHARSSVHAVSTKLSFSKGYAIVPLDCARTAACRGKLTLTATRTEKVKGKRRKVTVTIGTESFSIAAGRAAKIKINLSAYARAQVKSTHGHLHSRLSILGHETEPIHARIEAVTIS